MTEPRALSLKLVAAAVPAAGSDGATLTMVNAGTYGVRVRDAVTRRALVRLVELGGVTRVGEGNRTRYVRNVPVDDVPGESVPIEPPQGSEKSLDAKGHVLEGSGAFVGDRKPYEGAPVLPPRERSTDTEALPRVQRREAAIARSRNGYVNAALDWADKACGALRQAQGEAAITEAHRNEALLMECQALRDAADLLERRVERAAKTTVIPANAGTQLPATGGDSTPPAEQPSGELQALDSRVRGNDSVGAAEAAVQ